MQLSNHFPCHRRRCTVARCAGPQVDRRVRERDTVLQLSATASHGPGRGPTTSRWHIDCVTMP